MLKMKASQRNKRKEYSLNGNRKLINACRKAGLKLYNPRGEWNGYGYTKLPLVVSINSEKERKKFLKCKRNNRVKIESYAEKKEKWCKKLSSYTGISIKEAKHIAENKEDAKNREIEFLENRQVENYSRKRAVLINKLKRSNPLRDIKGREHAKAILIANNRHTNTEYDNLLAEGRELAEIGKIDKGDVKEYARKNMYIRK